jgi:ComEC/Rec2-related protein
VFCYRYPAVVVLAGAAVGAVVGYAIRPPMPAALGLLIAAGLGLFVAFFLFPRTGFVILLVAMAAAGTCFRMSSTPLSSLPADADGNSGLENDIRFFGTIDKWPVLERHKTIIPCRIDSVAQNGVVFPFLGAILLTVSRETTHFSLGDEISFIGQFRQIRASHFPGQPDYARYLQAKGLSGTVYITDPSEVLLHGRQQNFFGRGVNEIRQWILDCFRTNLTETSAALASGFLIGETHDIPDDVYTAFRRTGTMHLLAVSGSNVALVLVVVAFLFRAVRVRPLPRLLCLLGIVFVFSHLSYNQPSVVRASIMAALLLMARVFYRRADMHNIIAAAAAVLIFYDPHNLFDVGFQLSFAVTWGLILFLPAIYRLCRPLPLARPALYLVLVVSSSLIATLISAPITAYYFGEISLVTIFSNLLIVPLVTVAVVGIISLLLLHLAFPFLAVVPGALLDRLLAIILDAVSWFGQWRWASTTVGTLPAPYVYVWLAGLAVIFLALNRMIRRRTLIILGATAIGCIAIFLALGSAAPKPDLEVYNLGWGQIVMINRGEGAVIFQQHSGKSFDGFSDGLIPYLTRAEGHVPRDFIFLEPWHRTEQRLQSARALETGFSLCPISTSQDRRTPSLWRPIGDRRFQVSDSGLSFDLSPGVAISRLADSPLVVFVASPGDLAAVSREVWAQARWCVVCCTDSCEMAAFAPSSGNPQMVLLPTRTAQLYSPPARVVSVPSDPSQLIVAEGESAGLTDSSRSNGNGF